MSGAVALHPRFKDMPMAEGDTSYELKGGINTQVFVMTGNVASTPSYGEGELKGGYLRTFCTGMTISGTAELPKINIYNLKEGLYVTEPDSTHGWSFPNTIETNISVFSSQFDPDEVWLSDYFDGADKTVGAIANLGPGGPGELTLKDVYVDVDEGADSIFFGGDAFFGGGASDSVSHNLKKYFSLEVNGVPRVYVRPLKKNRMKGLWTATTDKREGKQKWSVYAPFWKWKSVLKYLKTGKATVGGEAEEKDATTNNTIFNHIAKTGDYGNPFATTDNAPLLSSIVEISTTKAKTGGSSLRMYHMWGNSSEMSGTRAVEKSLGRNFVNPQVAKAALYDIPIPVPLDLGTFDYSVSGTVGAAVALSGTCAWDSGSTAITGSSTFFTSGNQVVSGSIVRLGWQNYRVVTIDNDTNLNLDRAPSNYLKLAADETQGMTGPISSGTGETMYNVDTDLAKSYASGAHLTDKRVVFPELDITMNIAKLPPSPAINPLAKTKYVGTNGRIYYAGGRLSGSRAWGPMYGGTGPWENSSSVPSTARGTAQADKKLSTGTNFVKGGPLRTLLRSVVVTFSSYKSDTFDTLDDFIDYGMKRYYLESENDDSGLPLNDDTNIQNNTQLCGIVFQREYGNGEDKTEDPDTAVTTGDDLSLGDIYAYALPVTQWIAPKSYNTNATVAGAAGNVINLNDDSYGHEGINPLGGMCLVDNSLNSEITDASPNDAGVKLIGVQPKYDTKHWNPALQGSCSLTPQGSGYNPTFDNKKLCEEAFLDASFNFTSGSAIVETAAYDTANYGVGTRIAPREYTPGSNADLAWEDGYVIESITDSDTFVMNKNYTGTTGTGLDVRMWGFWKPKKYTNVNGSLEPHWVKIPMDSFFTMKFVFDKYAHYGSFKYGTGGTYSYQDYTTGQPTDYYPFASGSTDDKAGRYIGVPIRCYFEGATTGSTQLGSPLEQVEGSSVGSGPSGSSVENLPYINLPLMFASGSSQRAWGSFMNSGDNTKGMLEAWPKHMTIWVNNYRFTKYTEGDDNAKTSVFLGGTYTGSTSDTASSVDYTYTQVSGTKNVGIRGGADEIMYGNANPDFPTTGAAMTGSTEAYLAPEVEVFIDSVELKHFNIPTMNHSIAAGKMQKFITLQNNELLSPVTTYTSNTTNQGGTRDGTNMDGGAAGTYPAPEPTTLLTRNAWKTLKGFEHSGKWQPVKPGLNLSIGFKDNPALAPGADPAGFPITGAGGLFSSGKVHDIYLLMNNFSTSQFGRINQLEPSISWTPAAGIYSSGSIDGLGANMSMTLGNDMRGRTWAQGMIISGGSSSSDNRAAWAGSGYQYSPDYAGYSYYPTTHS